MVHLNARMVQDQLKWRRDKVREYSIKGYTQRDIGRTEDPIDECQQRFEIS